MLLIAALLTFFLGLVHSVLGESLIFHQDDPPKVNGTPAFRSGHFRILRATWHVATVLAWGYAACLLWLSAHPSDGLFAEFFKTASAWAFLMAALAVLVGTKGRHPGWTVMLAVAAMLWLA